jgi:hypothetical protein
MPAVMLENSLGSAEAAEYLPALEKTATLIDGSESPLGMGPPATVGWLLVKENLAANVESIRAGLSQWPGGNAASRRKLEPFDDRLVNLALGRLTPSGPTASTNAPYR